MENLTGEKKQTPLAFCKQLSVQHKARPHEKHTKQLPRNGMKRCLILLHSVCI